MKIGIISDTHLSAPSSELTLLMNGVFSDVAIVIHAGDLTHLSVLDAFSWKETVAVCGNMDRKEVAEKLPARKIVNLNGYRIGIVHGWGAPFGIEKRIMKTFDNVQAIVYGHTHKAANHIRDDILMFNPGAFSGSFLLKRNRSVGVLTVDDGITGEIFKI